MKRVPDRSPTSDPNRLGQFAKYKKLWPLAGIAGGQFRLNGRHRAAAVHSLNHWMAAASLPSGDATAMVAPPCPAER
jgi:hypothetical protein